MEIVQESIDELNAVLKVSVKKEDYQESVEKILKDYRKQANIPGFRKGQVPFGMIKKMYGKSVLADELNKVVYNSLHSYIDENKINILGNPLPKVGDESKTDLDNSEFEFEYEVGLSPSFEVAITDKEKFTTYDIAVDQKLIDKQVSDLAKRYGAVTQMEITTEKDMVQGEFNELNDAGEVLSGGINHISTVALEYIDDAKAKKALVGVKLGDTLIVEPKKLSKGTVDLAAMLNIDKSIAENLTSKFSFTVKTIYQMKGAEINQELFDKIFGPGQVKTEEEFRTRISAELKTALDNEAQRKLKIDITEKLVDKLKLSLPDSFLKRWLLEANKEKLSSEQIEKEYDEYAKGLRWQLIENKIIKEHDLQVTPEDAHAEAMKLIRMQMQQYGILDYEEEKLVESATNIMANQEEAKKIYDQLFDVKIMDLFKSKFKLKNKEVTYDEFVKLASGEKSKFNLFNSFKF